jgi:hypothetical protein
MVCVLAPVGQPGVAVKKRKFRTFTRDLKQMRTWLKNCRVTDIAMESTGHALGEAEAAAGLSIERAVVGMGGPTLRGANGRGVLELGRVREIEQRDVNRVVNRAARVQLHEDQMLLQLFPQAKFLHIVRDPRDAGRSRRRTRARSRGSRRGCRPCSRPRSRRACTA